MALRAMTSGARRERARCKFGSNQFPGGPGTWMREWCTMGREANEAGLRRHLAAENRHDMAATLATFDPGCVFVDDQLGQRWLGRDGAREHYTMWWSAFGNTVEGGQVHWV